MKYYLTVTNVLDFLKNPGHADLSLFTNDTSSIKEWFVGPQVEVDTSVLDVKAMAAMAHANIDAKEKELLERYRDGMNIVQDARASLLMLAQHAPPAQPADPEIEVADFEEVDESKAPIAPVPMEGHDDELPF